MRSLSTFFVPSNKHNKKINKKLKIPTGFKVKFANTNPETKKETARCS